VVLVSSLKVIELDFYRLDFSNLGFA
jgi:hypothetical protein